MGQELITHFTRHILKDCFTIVTREVPKSERGPVVLKNSLYEREARYLAKLSQLYAEKPQKE